MLLYKYSYEKISSSFTLKSFLKCVSRYTIGFPCTKRIGTLWGALLRPLDPLCGAHVNTAECGWDEWTSAEGRRVILLLYCVFYNYKTMVGIVFFFNVVSKLMSFFIDYSYCVIVIGIYVLLFLLLSFSQFFKFARKI